MSKEVAEGARDRRFSRGMPSVPLFGRLPLARVIPQDLHSLFDYVGSIGFGFTALLTDDAVAQGTAIVMMAFGVAVSLATDYRFSLAKLVPIEIHESLDYLLGVAMVLAPFLLGYVHATPLVAVLHELSGVALMAMAAVTDYRAFSSRNRAST